MNAIVKSVTAGSPASKTKIAPGDILRRINTVVINDVLDYEYYSYDSNLVLEFTSQGSKIKLIQINKPEGDDLGIEFENFLMDKQRHCVNKCIFCFIDQMPKGMRKTLYYKDDDVRLSFLQGNYVTLTNLSGPDIRRIIRLRISPINVSVHTLNPKLRSFMLGGSGGDGGINALKALAKAGIELNCQIVCCPGINDGWRLSRTIEGLIKMGSCINSVSVVPVGLTKYRQGLAELRPFDKLLALKTIRRVERYSKRSLKKRGSRVFYCADELYMLAGLELPPNEFYEDYPQLENGVGMMRLFITEFEIALQRLSKGEASGLDKEEAPNSSEAQERNEFSIVTGVLAEKYLTNLLKTVTEKYDTISYEVYAVKNDFFGESVSVSGLVTGGDIINRLKNKKLGSKLLIPQNMLRDTGFLQESTDKEVFLDNITVSELSEKLGVPVRIVKQDGADFLDALLGN